MTSPLQLVETLSSVTGMSSALVTDLDRRLVTAGLRTKGGRGFNAARMTPRDAARLLTAILAAPQANQAAIAVERFEETRVNPSRSSEGLFAASGLADLNLLPHEHSFVEGLTQLINSAATGSLASMIAAPGGEPPQIEVAALTRAMLGRIRISGLPTGLTASLEYAPMPASRSAAHSATGDLEQSRRVTGRTLFALAALFSEETS